MYLLLIFLPLVSAVTVLLFGRFLGQKGSSYISLFLIFISFLISMFLYFEVCLSQTFTFLSLKTLWFSCELLLVEWSFLFDVVTCTMLLVVFFISFLVHLYSMEYMAEDPHIRRFLSYLSFFTFFMSMLLTSGNFIQMFLGWEGVGLSSYLLINFWFTRIQANKSALKAMILNRVGDLGLALGICLIFILFKTVDFSLVFCMIPFSSKDSLSFFSFDFNYLDLICSFLFLGVIGKSAQFGLHAWLPDAMEGPTPVSALIHAATMVTAGVFLVIRCSPIFEYAPKVLFIISFLGALTAFFGATVACFQTDLKKIIAYSTCSQLGYMILACGFSMYSASLFHFFNHAFFKALLFLSAGSVIHALAGEQDVDKMGGLDIYLPYTSQMFLIGTCSLASFPFFSGFYSKDWILEIVQSFFFIDGSLITMLATVSAVFTMFYSNSIISFVFDGDEESSLPFLLEVNEPHFFITITLGILGFFSIFSGFFFKDFFIGFGTPVWANSIFFLPENFNHFESEYLSFSLKFLPVLSSFFISICLATSFDFGVSYFMQFFIRFYSFCYLVISKRCVPFFVDFFSLNWCFDSLTNYFVIFFFLKFCYVFSFKLVDKGLLEWVGPLGIFFFFEKYAIKVASLASGYLYQYAFVIIFGLSLLLILNFYVVESISFELIFFQFIIIVFSFLAFDWCADLFVARVLLGED